MARWRCWTGILIITGILSGCGGQNATTPQEAAVAFFNAFQARDQVRLRELAHPEMQALFDLLCSERPSECIERDLNVTPNSFDGPPDASLLNQTGTIAQVQLRQRFTGQGARCSVYSLEQRGSDWFVKTVQGYQTCAPELTATASEFQMQAAATAEADMASATATWVAKPTAIPELFLTARQAFDTTKVVVAAQSWSPDAILVEVRFFPNYKRINNQAFALDGTSRLWNFYYASPTLQKILTLVVQDGVLVDQSHISASDYKTLFAGKSAPQALDLTRLLDSDQALTIARENGFDLTEGNEIRIALTTIPDTDIEPYQHPVPYWNIIRSLGIRDVIVFRADTGDIEVNTLGPTGSPGAIPTPLAPPMKVGESRFPDTTPTTNSIPGSETVKQAFLAHAIGSKMRPEDVLADGVYVRVMMPESGAIMFYKQEKDDWTLIASGTMFDPDALTRLGIPNALWPK